MRTKYPRTPHLPWSRPNDDDVQLFDLSRFQGAEIVVTEKMDGENTTLYSDGLHARSLDSRHHPSRCQIKQQHASFATQLPPGWRFCGENLYARHSLAYEDLQGFFYLFAVFDDQGTCLSWDDTCEWAALLALPTPRLLFRGLFDEKKIRALSIDTQRQEGYVMRLAGSFAAAEFSSCIGKWVRSGHVQTDQHWMHGPVIPNHLAPEARHD